MTNQTTIDKLLEMRLHTMAEAFRIQSNDPEMKDIPFDDRFGMIVDLEYNERKNNRLKRLIQRAGFEQRDASIAGIDYVSGRKLNRALIERLASGEYIMNNRNIFITGATGSGKSYLACAFGMEACKQYHTVKYVRLPDLLLEAKQAKDLGKYRKFIKQYTNPVVLIIDECLLMKPDADETQILFELIHKRRKNSSTIFCSQYIDDDWYYQLGGSDNPLTDAIMDRIKYDSYKINIEYIDKKHDRSMREVYGLDSRLAE